jgi:hypothetical protein
MKRTFLLTALVVTFFQYGCLKSPEYEQLSSEFVVTTNTDVNTDFSTLKNYYISDSVTYIQNGTDSIIKDANSKKLVDAVKSNMAARGFTFVPKGNANLGVMMGIAKNTYVGVVYSGWWDAYAGWWDPWYWGWYYPYYYPWSVAYTVTTGSVIVTMVDLKNASVDHNLKIVWTGFMGGAVGDNLATNVDRGVTSINQAFAQSPLVKAN